MRQSRFTEEQIIRVLKEAGIKVTKVSGWPEVLVKGPPHIIHVVNKRKV